MGVFYKFFIDIAVFKISFVKLQIVGVAICVTFGVFAAAFKTLYPEKEKKPVDQNDDDYQRSELVEDGQQERSEERGAR